MLNSETTPENHRLTDATAGVNGLTGGLPPGRIAIIASRYNPAVCDSMLIAAQQTLLDAGVAGSHILVVRVPGAWELCWAVERVFQHADVIAAITLGAVIQGETTHDEYINRSVSESLMRQSIESGRPIGFGLLTCRNADQAIQRSGGSVGNKGQEAADAVLECLRLQIKLR